MADLKFGTDVRYRLCLVCSEPFVVPMAGGGVSCPSCGAEASLQPRHLEPLVEPAAFEETPEQWGERLPILKRQFQSYNRDNKYSFVQPPEGLEPLQKEESPEALLLVLLDRVGRCEERGTSSAPDERAIFWLASRLRSILSAAVEPERVAAVMHTSLDAVADRGFRHGLQCRLVRLCLTVSDLEGADSWLALCDPVPRILDLDSDYRIGRAMLSGHRGEWSRVLALVGDDEWAVPYEPAAVALLGGLRVAALERLGRGDEAEEAMKRVIEITPGGNVHLVFLKMFGSAPVFGPALEAWKRAEPERHGADGGADGGDDVEVVPGASPNAAMLVATVVTFVLGVAVLSVGFYFLAQYQKEWAYKKTQGTLVKVESRSAGSGSSSSIRVYVQYRYEVDSKTYDGRIIETDKPYYSYDSDHSAAQRIMMLKRHNTLPVYYDPKRPDKAILERQNAVFHAVPFVVTGMIWVAALFFLWLYWKKRRIFKKKMEEAARREAEQERPGA